jgi:hypothetical protein
MWVTFEHKTKSKFTFSAVAVLLQQQKYAPNMYYKTTAKHCYFVIIFFSTSPISFHASSDFLPTATLHQIKSTIDLERYYDFFFIQLLFPLAICC